MPLKLSLLPDKLDKFSQRFVRYRPDGVGNAKRSLLALRLDGDDGLCTLRSLPGAAVGAAWACSNNSLNPPGAIKAEGTWSLGASAGDFVFVAGMQGIDPATNTLVEDLKPEFSVPSSTSS